MSEKEALRNEYLERVYCRRHADDKAEAERDFDAGYEAASQAKEIEALRADLDVALEALEAIANGNVSYEQSIAEQALARMNAVGNTIMGGTVAGEAIDSLGGLDTTSPTLAEKDAEIEKMRRVLRCETPEDEASFVANWLRGTIVIPEEVRVRMLPEIARLQRVVDASLPFDKETLAAKACSMFGMIDTEQMMRTVKALRALNMSAAAISLLNRGLNLCAESRNIEKAIEESNPAHCASPYVWKLEKHEKDLAQWERDTSNLIAAAQQEG